MSDQDFYEPDEPAKDVLAAFNAGPTGWTWPPGEWARLTVAEAGATTSAPAGERWP